MSEPDYEDDFADHDPQADRATLCHYCHGDGWITIGLDCDVYDGVNGPFEGETQRCPCCHGSGKAEDETFW